MRIQRCTSKPYNRTITPCSARQPELGVIGSGFPNSLGPRHRPVVVLDKSRLLDVFKGRQLIREFVRLFRVISVHDDFLRCALGRMVATLKSLGGVESGEAPERRVVRKEVAR